MMGSQNVYILLLFSLILLCLTIKVKAQNQDQIWTTTSYANVQFDMPQEPVIVDTLSTLQYRIEEYQSAAYIVQIHQGAFINQNDEIVQEALMLEEGNELRAIARILLLTTRGTLTELQSIQESGVEGLRMGIIYPAMPDGTVEQALISFFL
jgi:hypothetical protein